jgi:hypothetical protein
VSHLILSRRQSATTAGAPTDYARVCLAALPPVSAKLSGVVGQNFEDWNGIANQKPHPFLWQE